MSKRIIAVVAAVFALAQGAGAQVDLQTYFDFGKDRKYISTTFEMFKGDKWGDTFIFVDHYFTHKSNRDAGLTSAINGSYFEIERSLNFWQNTALKDLSAMIEYDGSTWNSGMWCFGAKYFLHSEDFRNTFSLILLYDLYYGMSEADIPVKFSGVWGMKDFLGLKNLSFQGFIDIWGNNLSFDTVSNDLTIDTKTTKVSILAEPQLWYSLSCIGIENLNIGCEIELSLNFAGHKGFMCNPCIGTKWVF
ncbi:MAG: DUF5020 family protein [Candidatus Cryptobacteroides sp.]